METINIEIIETILVPIAIILAIILVFKIFTWPISIAKNKNLHNNEIMTIRILTWCGIFAGITWFIALCFALSYKEPQK